MEITIIMLLPGDYVCFQFDSFFTEDLDPLLQSIHRINRTLWHGEEELTGAQSELLWHYCILNDLRVLLNSLGLSLRLSPSGLSTLVLLTGICH